MKLHSQVRRRRVASLTELSRDLACLTTLFINTDYAVLNDCISVIGEFKGTW